MKCIVLVSGTLPDFYWLKWDESVKSLPKLMDNLENGSYKLIDPHYYTTIQVGENYGVELRIDNVTEDDFGLYTCFVSNFIGSVTIATKDETSRGVAKACLQSVAGVGTILQVVDAKPRKPR